MADGVFVATGYACIVGNKQKAPEELGSCISVKPHLIVLSRQAIVGLRQLFAKNGEMLWT